MQRENRRTGANDDARESLDLRRVQSRRSGRPPWQPLNDRRFSIAILLQENRNSLRGCSISSFTLWIRCDGTTLSR